MKYAFTLIILFVIFNLHLFGQISEGGMPKSFTYTEINTGYQTVNLPTVNHQQMLREDSIESINKTVPFRFGKALETDLNTDNSGSWQTLNNGDKIWQLCVEFKRRIFIKFYI